MAGRRRGLSLAEALVVLVISSLVLSIALPLAARSVIDNLRIGNHGLSAQDLSLREETFRRVLKAAVQPSAPAGAEPIASTVAGDSRSVRLTVLAEEDALCARGGQVMRIELRLDERAQSSGLNCASDLGSRPLLALANAQSLSFAYSADGRVWSDHWPLRGDDQNEVLVEAPLVRLLVATPSRTIVWIERAGATAPLNYELRARTNAPGHTQGDTVRPP